MRVASTSHAPSSPDLIEFWLEIVAAGGGAERCLHVDPSDRSVRDVLADFQIVDGDWRFELVPPPCLGWAHWDLEGVHAWERHFDCDLGLETFGVLPGSTLRVVERDRAG